ncbi:MBL fold metallo-hydrolase [Patescibacteria group bacterium]|nr:MBL fold metallo-hydrolase [Patescibacteria group bacterium]MBP9710483.1 MBL fold metallo-hydrolase [Patescibacteria group bacterium]
MSTQPKIHSFFDPHTYTVTHVVADPETHAAAIIDSVLDYDPVTGGISHESADKVVDLIRAEGYRVDWILETHAHADHVTAAYYLKQQLGGQIAIGGRITEVQQVFVNIFNLGAEVGVDGRQFDHLWKDEEVFRVGSIEARVLATPGHTPADVTYLIGDAAFVGDTMFMPDYGTARCDFPGGNAQILFDSVQRLYTLPDETRVFLCHDYLPETRTDYHWETTILNQKQQNIHVAERIQKEAFVQMRHARDKELALPRLIIPSIQINIRAGALPESASNGIAYLKVPINSIFAGK